MKRYLAIAALALVSTLAAAESTKPKLVGTMQVVSTPTAVQYYFYVPGGLGAPSCPFNYIAYTTSDIWGGADIAAGVLQSKIYGRNVVFVGTCVSPNYFFVTQVLMD